MAVPTITIDMDKKCPECGKGGATGNGICLGCTEKAIQDKVPMKSPQGNAVRERLRKIKALRP